MNVLMFSLDSSPLRDKDSYFACVLKELNKYWDNIIVIVPYPRYCRMPLNERCKVVGFPKILYPLLPLALIFKKVKIDFVISQDPAFTGLPAYMLAKLKCILWFCELHGTYLTETQECLTWKDLFLNKIGKFLIKRAHVIRVVNKKIYHSLKFLGIPEDRLLYIRSNYIHPDFISPSYFCKNSNNNELTLAFVGRLVKEKGVDLLLNILPYLKDKINFKLFVVGSGPDTSWFKREIRKLGLNYNVQFVGWLSRKELAELYSKVDFLLITSYHEGGPRVAYEAMACGTPIISTDVGELSEFIENGIDGIIISSREPMIFVNTIIKLASDKEKLREMRKRAQKKVLKYCNWNALIREYAETYKKLIKNVKGIA